MACKPGDTMLLMLRRDLLSISRMGGACISHHPNWRPHNLGCSASGAAESSCRAVNGIRVASAKSLVTQPPKHDAFINGILAVTSHVVPATTYAARPVPVDGSGGAQPVHRGCCYEIAESVRNGSMARNRRLYTHRDFRPPSQRHQKNTKSCIIR